MSFGRACAHQRDPQTRWRWVSVSTRVIPAATREGLTVSPRRKTTSIKTKSLNSVAVGELPPTFDLRLRAARLKLNLISQNIY